ncbi:P-II family nitrogen regulator [Thermodesulfovibrio yellowstonii]|uniref:Nitrogen regulatory protein P-II n=1 Tax=Thermodesulfovibrio yellowstonii TaxID=28262 RepID=A0A9W6LJ76_9BACT|nr:P-II family nitrogen regulator [Thermodesulfovibrio islandicus]GLI52921.1 nitrogen regulatory protein P-II [Thermodesulfovibrio islandicus]
MKEIIAIIRRDKTSETKKALEEIGFPSLTLQGVEGRGRQRGNICPDELDSDLPESYCMAVKLKPTPSTYALEHVLPKVALFVPKRMLTIIVPDKVVELIINKIIEVNRTGKHGDGKIFVCPIQKAIRIRTGEENEKAIS